VKQIAVTGVVTAMRDIDLAWKMYLLYKFPALSLSSVGIFSAV
jgi:hypothetical protein